MGNPHGAMGLGRCRAWMGDLYKEPGHGRPSDAPNRDG